MTVKCVETSNRHVRRQIVDPYLSWPSGSHIGEQTVRILFLFTEKSLCSIKSMKRMFKILPTLPNVFEQLSWFEKD